MTKITSVPKLPNKEEMLISILSKMLSRAGNKPRERMVLLLEHFYQYLKYASDSSVAFIVRNYFRLHILGLVYSIIGFSTITVLFLFLHANPWLLAIVTSMPILIPLLTEFLWSHVADGNPHDYLKVLELKSRGIYKYLAPIVAGYLLSILFLYFSLFSKNVDLILTFLLGFVVMTFAFVGFVIFMCLTFIIGIYAALRNPQSYYRNTGRVCLLIVSEEKDLKVRISTFKTGLECLNEYTKLKFKLGLNNLQRYCNFFKFTALYGRKEGQNNIRQAVQNLTFLLSKEMELSDIVSATCSLMGKQILRFEDIFEELDFDSSVLRKIVKHLMSVPS